MVYTLTIDCVLIVVVSLLGGMLPLATVLNHTRLQVYLSVSAGSMLGAAFFHMLPEAARIGSPETIRWSALGLLSLFLLERFFSFHQHEPQHDHSDGESGHGSLAPEITDHRHHEPCTTEREHAARKIRSKAPGNTLSWGTAAVGLAIHSLVGGLALASAVSADFAERKGVGATGWGVFLATVVHKPADAMTIVSLMLRSDVPKWVAHLVNLGFALMIPLGVVLFAVDLGHLTPVAASGKTAVALSFSAGTFLCIALSDLLPELQFHSHDRLKLSFSLLAGVGLMASASMLECR